MKLINELNEREVQLGVADKVSWHSEYKDSAWIFLGEVHVLLPQSSSLSASFLVLEHSRPSFLLTFITHFYFLLLSAHNLVFYISFLPHF